MEFVLNYTSGKDHPIYKIIDDFYPDLDWLYPYLNSTKSIRPNDVNYAGVVSFPPKEQLAYALKKIKENFGDFKAHDERTIGQIRLTLAKDQGDYRTFVHSDAGLNVLIYLSGSEEKESGTTFYRHKDYGLTSMLLDPVKVVKMTLLLKHDTKRMECWQPIEHIKFKKNRAVFFDGRYFHSGPTQFYGESIFDGRITQNFFFQANENN